MQHLQRRQQIITLLTTALECSFYISPKNSGLTYNELIEFGRVFLRQAGEVDDVMSQVTTMYGGQRMIQPDPNKIVACIAPHLVVTPESITVPALHFWSAHLRERGSATP